jgi:hypothetical protein
VFSLVCAAQQIDYVTQIKNKPSQVGGPSPSDHIQFVSPNGNNANDGLSWATAKLTCAAAISALGTNNSIIFESPALVSTDCIAGTGSATGVNGYIWAPTRLYIGPSAQATAISNKDSLKLRIAGSLWKAGAPVDDFYDFNVSENSSALTSGSDFELNHSSISGGAGRFSIFMDTVIQNPRAATAAVNSNSFAFDNQGAYWETADGSSQNMLWEMANTVNADGSGSFPFTFRQNWVPIFSSACAGCSAEFALGGSGTLQVSGNYGGSPKWLFTGLNGSFNTMSLTHAATGTRIITFPDATDTLVGKATTDTLSNKTLTGASSANSVTLLNEQGATGALTGNSTDQTVYTYTLPASTLGAGKGLRITLWFTHNVGTAVVTYKVFFGATAYLNNTDATAAGQYRAEVVIFNNPGVTNAQHGSNFHNIQGAVFIPFTPLTSAITTSSSVVIKFTFNVANTDQVTGGQFITELIQ